MPRPHASAIVEDAWHRWLERTLRRRHWRNRVIGHTGYGSTDFLRVFARVLLAQVGVDRIEIAQTRVSEGERLAARRVTAWARKEGVADRIEIMGYCDGDLSVRWLRGVGGKVMNLLTKGSEKHCREQLRQTPEQHRKRVTETIAAAHKARIAVNVYLEDWSNGVRDSFDYVFAMVQMLRELPVERMVWSS